MRSKAIFILPPSSSDFDKFKMPSWNIGRIAPIGIITVASYLQQKGHDIKIIDCREFIILYKTNNYIPFVLKAIEEFNPDMIGISILTASFNEVKKLASEIKKKFREVLLIAGGPH